MSKLSNDYTRAIENLERLHADLAAAAAASRGVAASDEATRARAAGYAADAVRRAIGALTESRGVHVERLAQAQ